MNADYRKLAVLMMAAGIAGAALLAPVRAHEGHDHAAQRARAPQSQDQPARASQPEPTLGEYERSLQVYVVPDVTLQNANARRIRMQEFLTAQGPVMLEFMSTACTAACPALTRELSMVPGKLGAAGAKLRMISISTDPETDTSAQLKAYARQVGAGANWQFFTGRPEDIKAMQLAFNTYRGDKLDAEPLTFLRSAPGEPWVRIHGLASAEDLAREYRKAVLN